MSILFVVDSDDQLRVGMPWCLRFATETQSDFHLVVVGDDRKVLLKHAQLSVASHLEQFDSPIKKPSVTQIAADAKTILRHADSIGCRNVLMIRSDGDELQWAIFRQSRHIVVLLSTNESPPVEREHVFSVMAETHPTTNRITEKLLGLIPSKIVCDQLISDDRNAADTNRQEHIGCAIEDLKAEGYTQHDLLCIGVETPDQNDVAFQFGKVLMSSDLPASIALISDGDSFSQAITRSLSERITMWVSTIAPPMERDERVTLVQNLETGSVPNLEFLGLISASSMLAAFGLLQDSAAVIIGAMLIAPLMTPILGAGLSLSYGNRPLFKSSLLTILLGFVGALGASILFGWLVLLVRPASDNHLDWITPEMWSRCRPSPLDFCVGLVGGLAASYAQTRKHLSSALAGAAIAAALVPPISTAGLQIAFGIWGNLDPSQVPAGVLPIGGPILLVTVNVLTIMIGASFVLWARGLRNESTSATRSKWVPRVVSLLLFLTLVILVTVVGPEFIFPSDG
ncbi:DUF389 domain-containing protein [Planctomycetes bacterium K23_9]|uniref:DUF389 domain-containing protein n=1 Tax=Stieleria marina TaxID=1930275 RepID=A0A517NPK7_9BACT|nr:hypothetical protein K239x_10000 [Planctomycetes bacterium K23_9]